MSAELDARLIEWAKEYAGSRYEHTGWPSRNWLAAVIEYGTGMRGRFGTTPVGTAADEVEKAVAELERAQGGYRAGRVLRCEFWMPKAADEHRLQALKAIGLPMSRAGYYMYLAQAKYYVAGTLGLPVGEYITEACV